MALPKLVRLALGLLAIAATLTARGQVDTNLLRFQKTATWPGLTRDQGRPYGIALSDQHLAYLAFGPAGLEIVDYANRESPSRIANFPLPGVCTSIRLFETNLVALLAGTNGLHFVDVGNPLSPTLKSSFKTGADFKSVSFLGDYAYIATGLAGVLALDLSDTARPVKAGEFDTPGECLDVEVFFDRTLHRSQVYIADGTNGLLTTSTMPTMGPAYHQTATGGTIGLSKFGASLFSIDAHGDSGAIFDESGSGGGLVTTVNFRPSEYVVKWVLPPFPRIIGGYVLSTTGRAARIFSEQVVPPPVVYGYACDGTNDFFVTSTGLEIFEGTDRIGVLPFGGSSAGLRVDGARIYVGEGGLGVRTLRFAEATGTFLEIGATASLPESGFDLAGSNIFVLGQNSFEILDFSDAASPKKRSSPGTLINLPVGQSLQPRALRVHNSKAYLSTDNGLFAVFDVANVANPQLLKTTTAGAFKDMQVVGTTLFAAAGGLRAFTINADHSITPLQQITSSGSAAALKIVGPNAFLCDGEAGLRIFDVSNPAAMVSLAIYDSAGSVANVDVLDSIAYVADTQGGLVVLDVSNPGRPTLITNLVTSAPALDVKVQGNFIFAALGADGVAAWKKTTVLPQTITFPPIADVSALDDPFPVTVSSSSGLTVRLSIVSGPASIAGNTITPLNPGSVRVRATQDGNATYAPASAERVFQVRALNTAIAPWVQAQYPDLPAELLDANADPDGDGVTNLGEYLFNSDPGHAASTRGHPTASILDFFGDLYLAFHYPRPRITRFPMSIQVADFNEPAPRNWISYPVDFGGADSGDFLWPIANDGSFPIIRFTIKYP